MSDKNINRAEAEAVQVNIFDRTYSLRSGTSGHEYVRRVAELVDERMRRISSLAPTHDALKIAVLAALNIADELQRVKDSHESEQSSLSSSPQQTPESPATPNGAESAAADATETREENRRSWFEDIFDSEPAPRRNNERLSSMVSEKLKTGRRASHDAFNVETGDDVE